MKIRITIYKVPRQFKRKHSCNIYIKSIYDNKSLGNLERNFRFFPSKGLSTNNEILVENNEIVREEKN